MLRAGGEGTVVWGGSVERKGDRGFEKVVIAAAARCEADSFLI
jgi:hypothetical protein